MPKRILQGVVLFAKRLSVPLQAGQLQQRLVLVAGQRDRGQPTQESVSDTSGEQNAAEEDRPVGQQNRGCRDALPTGVCHQPASDVVLLGRCPSSRTCFNQAGFSDRSGGCF